MRKVTNGVITRFAGDDGQAGFFNISSGTTLATEVTGEGFSNAAFSSSGGVFFGSDALVAEVAPNNTIAFLVNAAGGTGVHGFSGDGGPALKALMTTPGALVTDPDGNLYITDVFNDRIRKVWLH